ncbi:hypothetical protein FGG08_000168 [Glutinoglossum americanum]|uniref:Major facilitator superfamily (MFS) profile domain-containing protein n=1 Tax=Glutinoglossum americanum TaxID=1670608 RepID=A0A9P8IDI5_9PEZI|nr:hypothetical protein FGG08_000168 [Glutinoglossum americanum]
MAARAPEPAITDQLKDNPIENIGETDLKRYVETLYEEKFRDNGSVTLEELIAGAELARNFGNHDDHIEDDTPQHGKTSPSVTSNSQFLGKRERNAIKVQRSLAFWREPKDLLVTLAGIKLQTAISAFDTLVRLRKERILAAEELCYIHFQIQAERLDSLGENKLDFNRQLPRIPFSDRLARLGTLARNRRSAAASMIVMLSQQLSGINILAFLASVFFDTAGLRPQPTNPADKSNTNDSLRLTIGFGAANAVFSIIAYFLIEPLEVENRQKSKLPAWMHGRRSLLLLSLGGGTLMLLILTFLLGLKEGNPAKLPVVMLFIILFTLCYSPGAGCVPFLYSAEVWPNEGREIGMSWAVFWNFLGAGILALLVPRGFQWGPSKLFGVFTALSFVGFLLVWLFVPTTDYAISLEDMSAKFNSSLIEYGKKNLVRLNPLARKSEVATSQGSNVPPVAESGT